MYSLGPLIKTQSKIELCQNWERLVTMFCGRTVNILPAGVDMDRNGVNR